MIRRKEQGLPIGQRHFQRAIGHQTGGGDPGVADGRNNGGLRIGLGRKGQHHARRHHPRFATPTPCDSAEPAFSDITIVTHDSPGNTLSDSIRQNESFNQQSTERLGY